MRAVIASKHPAPGAQNSRNPFEGKPWDRLNTVQINLMPEEEDERIRATAVSSLAHSIEALERAKSDEFLSQLDRVSSETRSRALKASIKRLKARTQ